MSNEGNHGDPDQPEDPTISFDEALHWAKDDLNRKREAGTWGDKFWYIVGGAIILIVILGLIFVFYWRNTSRSSCSNDSRHPGDGSYSNGKGQYHEGPYRKTPVLDSLKSRENQVPLASATTPLPRQSYNLNSTTFSPPPPPTIRSPGGAFVPAVKSGVQTGWWYYPSRPN